MSRFSIVAAALVLLAACGTPPADTSPAPSARMPVFEVDPAWPKMPDKWRMGGASSIATDSKGNLYTTETYEGKRVQKFVYKGLGPVRTPNQGVLWPRN